MEQERGMPRLQSTPALQEFPQLSRLHVFSARNQGLVADYLAHLRTRHCVPAMEEATIRALKSFAVLMPEGRQATLYHDLTQTTPTDIDAWIEASCRQPLAPGTIATCLRVGEVSRLSWSAIDLTQDTVRIDNSTGHVDRVVYLSPDVAKALRQWHGLQATAAPSVFPSRVKRKGGTALTARQIRNRMTRDLAIAGITKPYSPHFLRHTFATQLLHAGASLEVVKELMGHRSLDVTLRYTQLYDRPKRSQYDQAMAQVEKRHGFEGLCLKSQNQGRN